MTRSGAQLVALSTKTSQDNIVILVYVRGNAAAEPGSYICTAIHVARNPRSQQRFA